MTFTPITPGCCNRQDSGTVFLLAGCKQMRCIKINMVYLPMHHFLNVSGFPCFSLPHFILLFSLSHFERTVRDPIRCHPWSPIPGPQGSPMFATCSRWRPPSREDSDAVPAAGFGWNLKSLFLVRCYASRVLTRNVSVC